MWSKYNYINSIELLTKVDEYLMTDNSPNYKFISLDIETNGLALREATTIGFSFSVNSKQGFYIPLLEWLPDKESIKIKTINKEKREIYENGNFKCVWTGVTYPEFVKPHEYKIPEFIPPLIERWFSKVNLIFHNAPFDVNHIWILTGIDLKDSVFLDTALLSHIINENSLNGLKETANEWKDDLGIDPYVMANQEQKELGESVIKNGGDVTQGGKAKSIWRADPHFLGKYACADTFLTYGLFEVGLRKFVNAFGEDKLEWLFEEEVMPVCKEVVIPMKRKGVYIDVNHFKKTAIETKNKLLELEDNIIFNIKNFIKDFTLGKTVEEAVSKQKLIKKILQIENLEIPKKVDNKTGELKESLAKAEVKKAYENNPHWVYAYILGEEELKYSESRLELIKKELFEESEGRRYHFNIGSDAHLRWLFCKKLGLKESELPQTDSATKENPIASMKAEVLEEFMLPKFPWVKDILTFKKLRKLYSTYILPAIDLNLDGWLYMDMRQNGTVSGRFACSGGFNLQTLPNIESELETLKSCHKCGSENVLIHQKIEILADRECRDCGFIETDITRSSAIKKGFIAPPGYKIVNADYASLEPRAFSFVSGDSKLKEVYWKGLDLYSKVYCDVFDDEKKYSAHPDSPNFLKKLNKTARTDVKPIVLGIPYGANKFQVANLTGKKKIIEKDGKKIEIPDSDYGQWVIEKYLGTYTELAKYMIKCEIDCLDKGFVETLIGRRRHFQYAPIIYKFLQKRGIDPKEIVETSPSNLNKSTISFTSNNGNKINLSKQDLEILIKELKLSWDNCKDKDYWVYIRNLLKADLNNSKNFPIQGLAGHITNKGMLDTTRLFKQNNLDAWVSLQIHDEIMCYAKESDAEKAAECLKEGMENNSYSKKIDIPMIAEPTICNNVMEAK